MSIPVRALIAGFVATVVLSVLMLLKASMGLMPQMNAIAMLTEMAHARMGTPAVPAVGWLMHFAIGTLLWGLGFAALYDALPGASALVKALVFSVGAWLLMMVIPMPMADKGIFGLGIGPMAPVMTLVLHLIWGAVLGGVFAALPAAGQVRAA